MNNHTKTTPENGSTKPTIADKPSFLVLHGEIDLDIKGVSALLLNLTGEDFLELNEEQQTNALWGVYKYTCTITEKLKALYDAHHRELDEAEALTLFKSATPENKTIVIKLMKAALKGGAA